MRLPSKGMSIIDFHRSSVSIDAQQASAVARRDRRQRRLRLTGQGRALLCRAVPVWRAEHDALEAGLAEDAAAMLRDALPALR